MSPTELNPQSSSAWHEFLKINEIATRFRVADSTIRSWVKTGKIPQPIRVGRHLLWRSAEIDRILAPGAGQEGGR